MKKFCLFLIFTFSLLISGCYSTAANDYYYNDYDEYSWTAARMGYYIGDGFEYYYYDDFYHRPVIYIGNVPYWLYWFNGGWRYEMCPNGWGHIRHYDRPMTYCRPGFNKPNDSWRPMTRFNVNGDRGGRSIGGSLRGNGNHNNGIRGGNENSNRNNGNGYTPRNNSNRTQRQSTTPRIQGNGSSNRGSINRGGSSSGSMNRGGGSPSRSVGGSYRSFSGIRK